MSDVSGVRRCSGRKIVGRTRIFQRGLCILKKGFAVFIFDYGKVTIVIKNIKIEEDLFRLTAFTSAFNMPVVPVGDSFHFEPYWLWFGW